MVITSMIDIKLSVFVLLLLFFLILAECDSTITLLPPRRQRGIEIPIERPPTPPIEVRFVPSPPPMRRPDPSGKQIQKIFC